MNPPFVQALVDNINHVGREWITWFQFATGGGKATQPAVGGSPFTFQNTTLYRQQATVTGGTVASIQYSRDNSNYFTLTSNHIVLYPGDYLKITYSVLPTLTIFPV